MMHRLNVLEVPLRWASGVVALIGVFLVPWYLGSSAPVPGESYALGFSNRTGILALGFAIAIAIAARLVAQRTQSAISWVAERPVLLPAWQDAKWEYLVCGAWCVVWANVLWMWGTYLVDPAWCEARAFHFGLDMMAAGRVPYRDFMFNYGPATLYVPYWLSVATAGDLSFEGAYLLTLLGFTLAGFVCIFFCFRALDLPRVYRPWVLGLSLLAWGEVNMGLNGVPLRFFVLPASLVAVDGVVRASAKNGARAMPRIFAASFFATCACLAMSPEMGIAMSASMVAYGLCPFLAGDRRVALACWGGCLCMAVLSLVVAADYFLSVFAFASGGYNFPIYPNLHNVAIVGISMFVIPALIASALRSPSDDRSALAMALAVAGGMLLPAALGRCDPGHVFHDGVVPLMLMFPAIAGCSRRLHVMWAMVYIVLYVFLLQFSYWSYYTNNFVAAMQMRAFYEQNPQLVESWRQKWDALKARHPRGQHFYWSSVLPYPDDLDEFTRQGPVLLVAGNEWNLWLARYLVLQKELPRDYFHAYSQGAATPSQIERKVRESKEAKFLMIPEFVLAPLSGPIDLEAYGKGLDRFLSGLLFFPVRTTVKHPPFFPDSEIAKQLLEDYRTVFKYQGYIVAERKPTAGKRDSEKPTRTDTDSAP